MLCKKDNCDYPYQTLVIESHLMKIEFLPDGGFNRTGGFIEYDDDGKSDGAIYERGGHINVEVICSGLSLENEVLSSLDPEAKMRRRICGIGELETATWGSWSLSLLGSSRKHDKIHVSIHDAHEERVLVRSAGHRGSDHNDIDVKYDESFYVDIVLATSRFEKLLKQLREPDATLQMRVQFGGIPRFLATWSPSISEGRTIKFLDRDTDVSNSQDIPEGFFSRVSEDDDFEDPVKASIRVYNNLQDTRVQDEARHGFHHSPAADQQEVQNSKVPNDKLTGDMSQLVHSVEKLRGSVRLWMILLILAIVVVGMNW